MLVHAGWLAWSATWQSPTLNEPGHLASGVAHWKLGRFEPYAVNPPVVRMIAALPVLGVGCETDWSSFRGRPGERPEFPLGSDFIKANGSRSQWLFVLSRWICLPFSLLGAWMCFVWGRALFSPLAGVLACALWCVEPNIIAHGQLITSDIAATSLGLVSMWTFWRWLQQPGWWSAGIAGAGLALAVLAKFSWLVLFGLWPLLWILVIVQRRRQRRAMSQAAAPVGPGGAIPRQAAQMLALIFVAVYGINLAYGFDGSFSRLGSFQFASKALSGQSQPGRLANRFSGSPIAEVPVPLPRQFILGLDLQKKDFEHFPHESYLRGEWRQGGWWYYYIYAAAVKLPVGFLVLAITAVLVRLSCGPFASSPVARLGQWILLIPSVVLFAIVSSETGFNHHFRYVLPCFGPVFILTSGMAAVGSRALRAWIAANWTWMAVSSVLAAPHSLSYFNELAGGMRNGAAHLLHSNVDWGQDLVALENWIGRHPDSKPVYLAYYGFYDPQAYGVAAEIGPQGPFGETRPLDWSFRPGYYAISVNYLHGTAWRLQNRFAYQPFLKQTPIAWCGGSIAIYRVDERQAKELTDAAIASQMKR
ncbi:ArnT family glycosyltransferase [Caulifigura coniformis]|nr:phospholipid carrier-dependent glycosyltransferase [Caulifigura coniformis]